MGSPRISSEVNKVIVVDKSWCMRSKLVTSNLTNGGEITNVRFKYCSWMVGAIYSPKTEWLFVVSDEEDLISVRTYLRRAH